jgi:threonine synthase
MCIATMGEGNTPVVESARIGPRLGVRLLFKLEMCNPTGSYKDRFVAAQIAEFRRRATQACVATSSGNTGASLAAYCARYGIACAIFVNEQAPAGKLQQMQAHGARIFRVRDFVVCPQVTERLYRRLNNMAETEGIPLVVSAYAYCSDAMRAVQAIAAEIGDQFRERIDHVFVPVGAGGLFTAVSRGFAQSDLPRPRVHAVQPRGCDTVVSAFEQNRDHILPVKSTTRISGLSVPFDVDASTALRELRTGGGMAIAVEDEQVYATQRMMLREEGIWAEPAGATALAGCVRALHERKIQSGETVVCVVTGHGFKDPDSLADATRDSPIAVINDSEIDISLLEAEA